MSEELKKEWSDEFDKLEVETWGTKRLKEYISSLLAKQQEMTNSEWVAYGKAKGYHDYWKDMIRIALQEEFVKCIPEEIPEIHSENCEYQRKGCDCGYMERLVHNKVIADIKSNLKILKRKI